MFCGRSLVQAPRLSAATVRAAASTALRPRSGSRPAWAAAPRELCLDPVMRRRGVTTPPIGVAWSKTKPYSLCSRERSNAAEPCRQISSATVNSSSIAHGLALLGQAPGKHQEHGNCRLVVGAEDARRRRFPVSVGRASARAGASAAGPCPGVRTAAPSWPLVGSRDARQQVAGVAADRRAGVVLFDLESECAELRANPFCARRARCREGLSIAHRSAKPCGQRVAPSSASVVIAPVYAARARRSLARPAGARRVRERCAPTKLAEQRRGALGTGLELRVVLGGDEERVARASSIASTSRSSGEVPLITQARALQALAQEVVDLVTVAVTLVDRRARRTAAGRACRRAA